MLRRSHDMLDALWNLVAFTLVIVCAARLLLGLVVLLVGCGVIDETKNLGADIAEVSYCEVETCGEVFLCTMSDGTKNEWCWKDDDADELATDSGALSCIPTPRGGALGWPCLYCTHGRGANAYQGSWGCS